MIFINGGSGGRVFTPIVEVEGLIRLGLLLYSEFLGFDLKSLKDIFDELRDISEKVKETDDTLDEYMYSVLVDLLVVSVCTWKLLVEVLVTRRSLL